MDLYLGPMQHQANVACEAAILATKAPLSDSCVQEEEKADHYRSWVMRKPNGEIEPLEGESMLLKTPQHISLELRVPQGLRTPNTNFSVKCDDGVAYVTNKRVSSYLRTLLTRAPWRLVRPCLNLTNAFRSSTLLPSPLRHSSPSRPSYSIPMTHNPRLVAGSASAPGAGRQRQSLDQAAAYPAISLAWSSP